MRIEGPSSVILEPMIPDQAPTVTGIPLGAVPGDGVEVVEAASTAARARLDCPGGTQAVVERLSPQSVEVKCVEHQTAEDRKDQNDRKPKKPAEDRPPARDPDAPIIP
jgi:hypothetical protein